MAGRADFLSPALDSKCPDSAGTRKRSEGSLCSPARPAVAQWILRCVSSESRHCHGYVGRAGAAGTA